MAYEGYSFFLKEEFKGASKIDRSSSLLDRVTATATQDTGNYVDSRGFEVALHVHDPLPIIHLDKVSCSYLIRASYLLQIGRDSIKATAAEYRRELTVKTFPLI